MNGVGSVHEYGGGAGGIEGGNYFLSHDSAFADAGHNDATFRLKNQTCNFYKIRINSAAQRYQRIRFNF